jgi:hypothetical protein
MAYIFLSLTLSFLFIIGRAGILASMQPPATSDPYLGVFVLTETFIQPVAPSNFYRGLGVAIDGDTLAVRIRAASTTGERATAITLFERTGLTWVEQATLSANNDDVVDFGQVFALDGDTVAASGYRTVYIFQRDELGWALQAELVVQPEPEEYVYFLDLELQGDVLAVSVHSRNGDHTRGKVYLYHRSGGDWELTAELLPDTGVAGAEFGTKLALDHETLAVTYRSLLGNANESIVFIFTYADSMWSKTVEIDINEQIPAVSGACSISDISLSNRTLFAQIYRPAIPGKLLILEREEHGASWHLEADIDIDNTLVNTDFGMETKFVATEDVAVVATVANGYGFQALYSFVRTDNGWERRISWTNDHDIFLYYSYLDLDRDTLVLTDLDRVHLFAKVQSQLYLPIVNMIHW